MCVVGEPRRHPAGFGHADLRGGFCLGAWLGACLYVCVEAVETVHPDPRGYYFDALHDTVPVNIIANAIKYTTMESGHVTDSAYRLLHGEYAKWTKDQHLPGRSRDCLRCASL